MYLDISFISQDPDYIKKFYEFLSKKYQIQKGKNTPQVFKNHIIKVFDLEKSDSSKADESDFHECCISIKNWPLHSQEDPKFQILMGFVEDVINHIPSTQYVLSSSLNGANIYNEPYFKLENFDEKFFSKFMIAIINKKQKIKTLHLDLPKLKIVYLFTPLLYFLLSAILVLFIPNSDFNTAILASSLTQLCLLLTVLPNKYLTKKRIQYFLLGIAYITAWIIFNTLLSNKDPQNTNLMISAILSLIPFFLVTQFKFIDIKTKPIHKKITDLYAYKLIFPCSIIAIVLAAIHTFSATSVLFSNILSTLLTINLTFLARYKKFNGKLLNKIYVSTLFINTAYFSQKIYTNHLITPELYILLILNLLLIYGIKTKFIGVSQTKKLIVIFLILIFGPLSIQAISLINTKYIELPKNQVSTPH